MTRAWPTVALVTSMILSGIFLYLLGSWHGRIIRYDDCAYTRIGPQPVYVCPVEDSTVPVRSIPEGDPA